MNDCFSLIAGFHNMCGVDTYDWHIYVFLRKQLLIVFKGNIDEPANSDVVF